MNSKQKVIGIDPGLAATGYGIVEGTARKVSAFRFGTIRTSQSEDLAARLEHIFSRLCAILQTEKPALALIEGIFSLQRYPKSGIALGKVCGVLHLAGRQNSVPTMEIAAREVKQVLTGNGAARKPQMERSVRALLKTTEPISPSHASDALAIALVGLLRYRSKPS